MKLLVYVYQRLLAPHLQTSFDNQREIFVGNLSEVVVSSEDDIAQLMAEGQSSLLFLERIRHESNPL
jgi:hypothetical protein